MEGDSSDDELASYRPPASKNEPQMEPEEILEELQDLVKEGEEIVESILDLEKNKSKIENLSKLRRRISAELDFIKKIVKGEVKPKASHLQCSNIPYYRSLLSLVRKERNATAVIKVFQLKETDSRGKIGAAQRIEVDLVSKGGKVWLKVKALKPQTLQLVWLGQAQNGSKSITEQAKVLMRCASYHPHHYSPPLIALYFEQGISVDVAEELQSLGVIVLGQLLDEETFEPIVVSTPVLEKQQAHILLLEKLDDDLNGNSKKNDNTSKNGNNGFDNEFFSESIEMFHSEDLSPSKKVFMDVTSMLAYVSEVVNGDKSINSSDPVIQAQLEGERRQASLPLFNQFMADKELFVTTIAKQKFQDIVNVVGGDKEKVRADELLARLKEVPDDPSDRARALPRGLKLKDQHISVFGTADRYKATTMTSNFNFTRIARENGVSFSVYVHPARALTQQKTDFERELKEYQEKEKLAELTNPK